MGCEGVRLERMVRYFDVESELEWWYTNSTYGCDRFGTLWPVL